MSLKCIVSAETITHIKICSPNFDKNLSDHSCSSKEKSCSGIFLTDGWYPQSTAFKKERVNLELSAVSSNHISALLQSIFQAS